MGKKKTKQLKAGGPTRRSTSKQPQVVHLLTYEITSDLMPDPRYPHLPLDVTERLHGLVMTNADAAIPELLSWIERRPNIPMLRNFLAAAYGQSRRIAEYEQIVLDNFQRFPDYLFARLNYAELLVTRRDYEAVAGLLNHLFDIGLFYPERKRFHITEYVSFTVVVGLYYIGVGNIEAARRCMNGLDQIAPDAPMTQRFRRSLSRALIRHALGALGRRLGRSAES